MKLKSFLSWVARISAISAFALIYAELRIYRCVIDTNETGLPGCWTFGWDRHHVLHIHPISMVLGFVCFGSEALMTPTTMKPFVRKHTLHRIHAVLHLLGITSVTVGLVSIVLFYSDSPDQSHTPFHSLHAWVGVATIGAWLLQIVVALLWLFRPSVLRLAPGFRSLHKLLGVFLWVSAVANCLIGAQEWIVRLQPLGKYDLNHHELLVNLHGMSLYICLFCVMFVVLDEKQKSHSVYFDGKATDSSTASDPSERDQDRLLDPSHTYSSHAYEPAAHHQESIQKKDYSWGPSVG